MNCSSNELTTLPNYPKLEELICYFNDLITLGSVEGNKPCYPNLKELNCGFNKLTSIPYCPNLKKTTL